MSAQSSPSPANLANGQLRGPLRKKKPVANPLVKPKRPGQPRTAVLRNGSSHLSHNGRKSAEPNSLAQQSQQSASLQFQEQYEDAPIFSTRQSLLDGTRHHIMRLFPNTNVKRKDINPADPSQFTPPVKLHRRDPRADPSTHWKESGIDSSESERKEAPVDDKAREEAAIAKAARKAEREANQAQIAPTAKSEAASKRKSRQKKTEMVYQFTDSLTKAKTQQIRYEESLPWHLEDFDNKNMWAGTYEAALSEGHIMLVKDGDSPVLRMVPLEKWYKFLPKSHFKTLSIEQAEARMNLKHAAPRWFQRAVDADEMAKQIKERNAMGKVYTRQGERGERPVRPSARPTTGEAEDDERPEQAPDADIIDYNYDEAFADDEENQLFGGDEEENKEAEEKVKRERLEANVFDIKEEKDFDQEEEEEKRRLEEEKQKSKKLTKALKRREKNFDYEDEDDSDSDTSEVPLIAGSACGVNMLIISRTMMSCPRRRRRKQRIPISKWPTLIRTHRLGLSRKAQARLARMMVRKPASNGPCLQAIPTSAATSRAAKSTRRRTSHPQTPATQSHDQARPEVRA